MNSPDMNSAVRKFACLTLLVTWASPHVAIGQNGASKPRLPDRSKETVPKTTTARTVATGPLKVHPDNPRYFTDGSGKAIYLTGSHTWASLQDTLAVGGDQIAFDYAAYLDFMGKYNHNFFRLRAWERPAEAVSPAHTDKNQKLRPDRSNPPATNAGKVVLVDTDHIWASAETLPGSGNV